jgi:hypothetical protein
MRRLEFGSRLPSAGHVVATLVAVPRSDPLATLPASPPLRLSATHVKSRTALPTSANDLEFFTDPQGRVLEVDETAFVLEQLERGLPTFLG